MANFGNNLYQTIIEKVAFAMIFAVIAAIILAPAGPLLAQVPQPLQITDVTIVSITDRGATISWKTNREATGRVDYGILSRDYKWSVNTNLEKTEQTITISGLFPETTYYFRIVARDDFGEVSSFEKLFETKKLSDNKAPIITGVVVANLTGTTATIQWRTDEPATTEVEYGFTNLYGQSKTDGRRVGVHDITLNNLRIGNLYHFLVKSKDADNNTSLWYDMTFQALPTDLADRDTLLIYDIKPTSENDVNITQNSAVISWRTNKLAEGIVRYGKATSYGATAYSEAPRDFSHSVTLTNLEPGKTYYYEIQVKDVLNKETKSTPQSFTTKAPAQGATTPTYSNNPQVLGASSCAVDLSRDFGYFGLYYNLPSGHPDVGLYKGQPIPNSKVGRENDWYSDQFFSFSRVDTKIDFGRNFLPVNDGLPGDPYHFAVNWRAIINVPEDGFYGFEMSSDDDSWMLVDDSLIINLGGVRPLAKDYKEVNLTKGLHKLEIFYAERQETGAVFNFIPNNKLRFHPLPYGCELVDVTDRRTSTVPTGGNDTGIVLGVDNIDDIASTTPAAPVSQGPACNPNLGYTVIEKLYKIPQSPDIWAILETGQRHYITSPESFALYQCDWRRVQVVSRATLKRYDSANLVRTPA